MKRKLLATAIAGALVAPGAFAAQDTSGMRYTSASEGFYASIRVRFDTGRTDDEGTAIRNSSSRFGVRGSNDLGGGLEGFYTYESQVDIDNGSGLSTRLAHVGLRGAFGQVQVGSFWPQSYNWVHGSTDVANWASGYAIYNTLLPGRQSRALEYTTPDLNGFQASGFIEFDSGRDGEGPILANSGSAAAANADIDDNGGANIQVVPIMALANGIPTVSPTAVPVVYVAATHGSRISTVTGAGDEAAYFDVTGNGLTADDFIIANVTRNPKDDNDVDLWSISAKYSIQGFDAGVSYTVAPDGQGGGTDDLSLYAVRLGYAQDNWYVTGWYSEDDAGDSGVEDNESFSLAGGVGVGKVNVYAVYDNVEAVDEDEFVTVGVQYNLGSRSRVWIEYAGRDQESAPDNDDYVNIGLRHDF